MRAQGEDKLNQFHKNASVVRSVGIPDVIITSTFAMSSDNDSIIFRQNKTRSVCTHEENDYDEKGEEKKANE